MSKLAKALSGAAGNSSASSLYVEDVFSTYVYAGQSTDLAITNGLDFSAKGGLFWAKDRGTAQAHLLLDTERGTSQTLNSDSTAANIPIFSSKTVTYNSDGITLPGNSSANPSGILNYQGYNNVGWSFRKAEKFFDIVTYTGNGASSRTIAHSLGSVPAFMTVKSSSNSSGWRTYHASLGATKYVQLQSTAAAATYNVWNDTTPTDSVFSISTDINANGVTYVAYLFASDAGGFGEDEDENIISCGSYTGNATTPPVINLGWEPQWILFKPATYVEDWTILDVMRGWGAVGAPDQVIHPNTSGAESTDNWMNVTSTGFQPEGSDSHSNQNGVTYIYMAIRRSMKTPEAGTEVFGLRNFNETNDYQQLPTGNLVDLGLEYLNANGNLFFTRMIGQGYLNPTTNGAGNTTVASAFDFMDGFEPHYANNVSNFNPRMVYGFTRAAGFFDMLCYTGDGGRRTPALTHNLGVVPELVIVKSRNTSGNWFVLSTSLGQKGFLNNGDGFSTTDIQYAFGDGTNYVAPTSTALQVDSSINGNTQTFVAYLFATVAGVSKVGTYTGTGTTHNIDCGFTGGARFVMIKRADGSTNTGDWYVYDSARGISAGNDPYYFMNTTAAQVANTDYIDPLASGFTITSGAPAALNYNNGTFIFLAIA